MPFRQPIASSVVLRVDEVRVSLCVELTPLTVISICEPLVLDRRIRFGVLIMACLGFVMPIVFAEFLTLNL